jgi:hypothetical protein
MRTQCANEPFLLRKRSGEEIVEYDLGFVIFPTGNYNKAY